MRCPKFIQAALVLSLSTFIPATVTYAEMNTETITGKSTGPEIGYINGKEVIYENIDGWAIFEGDIILGTVEEIKMRNSGARVDSVVVSGPGTRWPNGLIPYQYEAGLSSTVIDRFRLAAEHWETNTGIRFVRRTSTNAARYPDYILVRPHSGCAANVGYQEGERYILLSSGCSVGNIIHEIGHAVGFWHEQSREDRNTFVRINWDNITPGHEHNFNQHISNGDDLYDYDYGSIMHYGRFAFSNGNGPTIEPINPPTAVIGQQQALSATDISTARTLYNPITCVGFAANETLCSYAAHVPGAQLTWNIFPWMPYISQGNFMHFTHPAPVCPAGTKVTMTTWFPTFITSSFTCGQASNNLALLATATASSTFPEYSPHRINDGSTNTTVGPAHSWANNANQSGPQWVQLDFDFNRTFSKVVLYTSAGYPLRDYDVQYWNGSGWTTRVAVRGNTALSRTHTFSAVSSSRLRILAINGPSNQSYYRRVNELQVYE